MSLEDLLQAMMGGGSAQKPQQSAGGLEDILGGILGGQQQQQQSGGSLEDILGGILGGQQQQQQSGGGGLEDILGGILGGGQQQQQQQSSGGGLMDIISAILGGGGNAGQSASPIIEGVSGKTGLSSIIVQMILSFVMSKLLGGMAGGASGQSGYSPQQKSGGGLDLDGLLEQMGQDKNAAKELAEQTGLDKETAQKGLDEILGALGAQRQSSGSQPSKKSGLDGLLENW